MSCETVLSLLPPLPDYCLACQSPCAQSWPDLYGLETASEECLSGARSLLSCPSKVSVARNYRGSEAQALVNFLEQVSESLAQCLSNLLKRPSQVLVRLRLDDKHGRRCLQLLSKVCKSQRIVPASYIFQPKFLRVGDVRDRGGFSQVSDGKYLERTVAIKDLKTSEGDFDRIFKVCMLVKLRASSFLNHGFRPALLSRGDLLEAFIAPKHLAFVGGFCINGAASFPHPLSVDGQRESGSVHKVQSRGKPLAISKSAPPHNSSCSSIVFSFLMLLLV